VDLDERSDGHGRDAGVAAEMSSVLRPRGTAVRPRVTAAHERSGSSHDTRRPALTAPLY